jgi:peroxiredoxin
MELFMKLKFSVLLLIVFYITVLAIGCGNPGGSLQVGDTHPSFNLKGIDGTDYSLKQFLSKKVLIVYVAKDCDGCEIEIPLLQTALKNIQNNVNVVLLFGQENNVLKISDFVNSKKWALSPILIDDGDSVFKQYGLPILRPVNVLLDANSVIMKIKPGAFKTQAEVENWVK